MQESMIKPLTMLILLVASAPNVFSILASVAAAIYFITMIKLNAVDKKYDGKWSLYFKSIIKQLMIWRKKNSN